MAAKIAIFGGIIFIVGWLGMIFVAGPIVGKIFDHIICPSYDEQGYSSASCRDGSDVTEMEKFLVVAIFFSIATAPLFMLPLAYKKRHQWIGIGLGLLVALYYTIFGLIVVLS